MNRPSKPRSCRHEMQIVGRDKKSVKRKCRLCPHEDEEQIGRKWGDSQKPPQSPAASESAGGQQSDEEAGKNNQST